MQKQNAVHPYSGLLYSLKKEGHLDTGYDLEDIMLSVIKQLLKDKYRMILRISLE